MKHRDTSRLLSPATPNASKSAPDPTSADRALDLERRTLVAICSAAVLLALFFGLHLLGPYFLEEHRRLRPWEIPAIWAGNAAGLLWFLRFLHRHFIAGEPFLDRPLRPFEPRRLALAITTLTLAGVALDLCVTLYDVHTEHTGYAAAARVTGEADRVDREDFNGHALQTNFQDAPVLSAVRDRTSECSGPPSRAKGSHYRDMHLICRTSKGSHQSFSGSKSRCGIFRYSPPPSAA